MILLWVFLPPVLMLCAVMLVLRCSSARRAAQGQLHYTGTITPTRDDFALAAMPAFLSIPSFDPRFNYHEAARLSYKMADLMLVQRDVK